MSAQKKGSGENVCRKCKKTVSEAESYHDSKNKILCEDCMDDLAFRPQDCPVCKKSILASEGVGLLLTPIGSSKKQKQNAIDTFVMVCPECRVLFFDEFHYRLIEGLKKK
jgi:hypothetical protein